VLPTETLVQQAKQLVPPACLEVQCGGWRKALQVTDLAIASAGTVTMECAFFGVPTVAMVQGCLGRLFNRAPDSESQAPRHAQLTGERGSFSRVHPVPPPRRRTSRAPPLNCFAMRNVESQSKTKLCESVSGLGGPGASRRAARAGHAASPFHSLKKPAHQDIPRKTIYRICRCICRCLARLKDNHIQTVSSEALAKVAGVKPTQLRKT